MAAAPPSAPGGARGLELAALSSGLVLAVFLWRSAAHLSTASPEDFIYYYAGTGLYWEGRSPYDYAAYQGRLETILGRPNPFPSKTSAFLYPPLMAWAFAPFAALPYPTAFMAWTLTLAASAGAVFWMLSSGLDFRARVLLAAVFLACPAAENALYTHRVLWLTLAACLAGWRLLKRGLDIPAGLAFGLMGLQPQWLLPLAVCLVLGGRWKTLAAALALQALPLLAHGAGLQPWSLWSGYFETVRGVQRGWVFSGNLSLAVGLMRLLDPAGHPTGVLFWKATPALQALSAVTAALFAAAAAWAWSGGAPWEGKTRFTLAAALWVQPYSHGSELLWAFPWIAEGLMRRFPGSRALAWGLAGAVGATLALRWALDSPAGRGHIASAYLLTASAAFLTGRRPAREALVG